MVAETKLKTSKALFYSLSQLIIFVNKQKIALKVKDTSGVMFSMN